MSFLNRQDWFPTPIWATRLEEITDAEEAEAIAFCKYIQSISPGREVSNKGGWQSNDMFFKDIESTPLCKYFTVINPLISQCLGDLGSNIPYQLDNIWLNINNKHHYNELHDHQYSVLSGVFYLTKNNSKIQFQRNRDMSTYFLEDIRSNNNTHCSYRKVEYLPGNKVLYLFPSWLSHRVLRNDLDTERISIAFNIGKAV